MLRIQDLYIAALTATQFPFLETSSCNFVWSVFFKKSQNQFFHFSSSEQFTLHFQMYSRRDSSYSYIRYTRGKHTFSPASKYSRKMSWGNSKKKTKVYLGEKEEEEAFSSGENTVIHNAKNIGLVLILELNSEKESTIHQELANCNKMYDIATYIRRQLFVTIKKYNFLN